MAVRNSRTKALLVFGVAVSWAVAAIAGSSLGQDSDRTVRLFNGNDLSGFYTWLVGAGYGDPERVFTAVDQVDGAPAIRVSGRHWGGLVTRDEFSDYRLTVEFRWGLVTWGDRKDKARDSGILLHCQGPDGNTAKDFKGPWMQSIECQIIEGGVGDIILVPGHDPAGNAVSPKLTAAAGRDRDGEDVFDLKAAPREFLRGRINWFNRDPDWKDVLGFRGGKDLESPHGQWTRVEVICARDKITHIVNGNVVNEGTRSSLTRGKICFQSEGAEIYFRRIDLKPLS